MTILIIPNPYAPGQPDARGAGFDRLVDAERPRPFGWGMQDLETILRLLAACVRRRPGAILAGEGVGATLIACLAARHPGLDIGAALLDSPADPERPRGGWNASPASLPIDPLPFPSILVARRSGPAMTHARARVMARLWDSAYIPAGRRARCDEAGPDGLHLMGQLRRMRDLAREPGLFVQAWVPQAQAGAWPATRRLSPRIAGTAASRRRV